MLAPGRESLGILMAVTARDMNLVLALQQLLTPTSRRALSDSETQMPSPWFRLFLP